MNKDNDLKRPNKNSSDQDSTNNQVVSPDLSAPLGHIKDRPMRDKLDEEKVADKALGDSVGNEVELDLNPNEESPDEDPK
ncbi:MAG: hypothetical protein JJU01_03365 [Alkalibacterium sp.]|nr:hypothetical protein [Alkalibacterium sp.]TVP90064.1 MAG: hypothetical protein EA249_08375 [Alkalibacterium sp.]